MERFTSSNDGKPGVGEYDLTQKKDRNINC